MMMIKNPFRRDKERDLQEFLPAALEIIERPASPVAIAMAGAISLMCLIALVWSFIGHTDVVAVAQGKIQPSGRVKIVQVLETGKVETILVSNGMRVKAGQALLDMETDEAGAEEKALRLSLQSSRIEILRRQSAIEAAAAGAFTTRIDWPTDIPDDLRRREDDVYRAEMEGLTSTLAHLDAQIAQKEMERKRLEETIVAQRALIGILRERVDMRQALVPQGAGTRASLLDAMESYAYQNTILAGQEGQLRETRETIAILAREQDRFLKGFLADQSQKRREAMRLVEDSQQRFAKAIARLARMTIRSPVDGIVHALAVHSAGQVITTGQEVMRIVPVGGPLEIEVYMPNKDIGFIHEGQEASIKLEAFPFTRYGTLQARVAHVGQDAIPEPDARQIEADPTRQSEGRNMAGAQRVQNLVFPVTLILPSGVMRVDGRDVMLLPGMAVTSEIKTGSRRLISYLLSPLQTYVDEAFRER